LFRWDEICVRKDCGYVTLEGSQRSLKKSRKKSARWSLGDSVDRAPGLTLTFGRS
jgi:hypothetical protein